MLRIYNYDSFGRLTKNTLQRTNFNPVQNYPLEFDYNATNGRLSKLRYPFYSGTSRIEVRLDYDPTSGEVLNVTDTRSGGATYWQRRKNNPDGQIQVERFGNGIDTTRSYFSETGRLSAISSALSSGVKRQDLSFKYWNDGSLKKREPPDQPAGVRALRIRCHGLDQALGAGQQLK